MLVTSSSAHPRSRGEHITSSGVPGGNCGSSPLARGTLPATLDVPGYLRLIPARAGNTIRSLLLPRPFSAHPRSRGEHPANPNLHALNTGSSPLARGTLWNPVAAIIGVRLIPARAGNTTAKAKRSFTFQAHPRSRGEHRPVRHDAVKELGSSPLARGTLYPWCRTPLTPRLIPARAGNTSSLTSRGISALGSSPLARGTHLLTWGFTPYISKIESLWSQSLHPEYTINNRP